MKTKPPEIKDMPLRNTISHTEEALQAYQQFHARPIQSVLEDFLAKKPEAHAQLDYKLERTPDSKEIRQYRNNLEKKENHNAQECVLLATLFKNSSKFDKNRIFLKKAMDLGDNYSAILLAEENTGMKNIQLLTQYALAGDVRAQRAMGQFYHFYHFQKQTNSELILPSTNPHFNEAIQFFVMAAHNDPVSATYLARMYLHGDGLFTRLTRGQDIKKGIEYAWLAIARGETDLFLLLSRLYKNGIIEKNIPLAAKLYRLGAQNDVFHFSLSDFNEFKEPAVIYHLACIQKKIPQNLIEAFNALALEQPDVFDELLRSDTILTAVEDVKSRLYPEVAAVVFKRNHQYLKVEQEEIHALLPSDLAKLTLEYTGFFSDTANAIRAQSTVLDDAKFAPVRS